MIVMIADDCYDSRGLLGIAHNRKKNAVINYSFQVQVFKIHLYTVPDLLGSVRRLVHISHILHYCGKTRNHYHNLKTLIHT